MPRLVEAVKLARGTQAKEIGVSKETATIQDDEGKACVGEVMRSSKDFGFIDAVGTGGLSNVVTKSAPAGNPFSRHFYHVTDFLGVQRCLPIRLLPTPAKCGVRPFPGVKPVEGWRDRATRYSEQRAERVKGIEAPIESKGELVEVGL